MCQRIVNIRFLLIWSFEGTVYITKVSQLGLCIWVCWSVPLYQCIVRSENWKLCKKFIVVPNISVIFFPVSSYNGLHPNFLVWSSGHLSLILFSIFTQINVLPIDIFLSLFLSLLSKQFNLAVAPSGYERNVFLFWFCTQQLSWYIICFYSTIVILLNQN